MQLDTRSANARQWVIYGAAKLVPLISLNWALPTTWWLSVKTPKPRLCGTHGALNCLIGLAKLPPAATSSGLSAPFTEDRAV